MKVVMVGPASVVHLLRWANGVVGRGVDLTVLTLHEPLAGYDPRIEMVKIAPPAPAGYLLAAPAFRREIEARRPDVIHVHYASGYGFLAATSRRPRILLSVWGKDVYEFPERSPLHRRLLRWNLAAAARLTSTSRAMAEVTRRLSDRPIDVVPFGVDTGVFRPADPAERNGVVVGTVKTMERKYGVDTLISAAGLLRKDPRTPPFSLRIVGGGPDLETLKAQAASLGLGDVATFVGRVPYASVPDELSRLTVAAFPSREDSESFGCAAVEAMACGVPVVASAVDGFREVLDGGTFGVLVPRDDPPALAEALLSVMLDPQRRLRMAEAGRRSVRERYEWSDCVEQMLESYERVRSLPASR